jgi:hypothetical protein
VVAAESPWDDAQRDQAEAAWHAEHVTLCPQCGNPREVCSDPERAAEQTWHVSRNVCLASASVERVWRGVHAKVDGKDPIGAMDEKLTDGMRLYATLYDATPGDDFLGLMPPSRPDQP